MYKITKHGGVPLTLDEVKYQLKLETTFTTDDNLLEIMLLAATKELESYLNRCFITSTIEEVYDVFNRYTTLSKSPLVSVATVEYYVNDAYSTLASSNYIEDSHSKPPRVAIKFSVAVPATDSTINKLKITYTAGYGTSSKVPEPIKQAILVLVAEMYERRENFVKKLPDYVCDMVKDYRVQRL